MAISVNVSVFHLLNVVDSCAIWNLLSSARLYSSAQRARCHFCCTSFVKYECLTKPRSVPKEYDRAIQQIFRNENLSGRFNDFSLEIDDLRQVDILRRRKSLSMGELSSIAFALKTDQAFYTDDQKARALAIEIIGRERVQTTPHLFGWMIFVGHLGDSDKSVIVDEHRSLSQGELAKYLEEIYLEALRCRLMTKQ